MIYPVLIMHAILIHIKPLELEKGDFILKTHKMLSVHTTPEKFKSAAFTAVILDLSLEETFVRAIMSLP